MSAPSTVTTKGFTPFSICGGTGILDESGIAIEDFTFEPKRTHIDTMDADMAIKMRKSVTPMVTISLKGKVKTSAATGIAALCPGDLTTLTNFPSSANTFDPSAGVLAVDTLKMSQKRLNTIMEIDATVVNLPHAS